MSALYAEMMLSIIRLKVHAAVLFACCAVFFSGCIGPYYSVTVKNPTVQLRPLATPLTVSYTLGPDYAYWMPFTKIENGGYCGIIWSSLRIANIYPFMEGADQLLRQYYVNNLGDVNRNNISTDHHLQINPVKYLRTPYLASGIWSDKAEPGLAKIELEFQITMTDRTGKGPGFTKEYHLQAEAPVSDMSTCEKYDKQGELSSQLMTEFFAQFQTDLVAYLQKTQ